MDNITEQSRFIINRFDHYFDSINNKGVFYITMNTFLLGGLLSQTGTIITSGSGWWIYFLVLAFIFINVSSTVLTVLSISPFKSPKCDEPSSLIYFNDIACKDLNSFKIEYTTQTEDFIRIDFTNQIHQLAGGLKIKFDRLRYAGILLLIQFVSLLPIIIITILNVK